MANSIANNQVDTGTWNQITKKGNRSSPNENISIKKRQTSMKDYWLEDPISTSNVFKVLENKQQMDEAVN